MPSVYELVTQRVIDALEAGVVPWRKPWDPVLGRPRSMATNRPYRGVNLLLLAAAAAASGYDSPYWGTYRQIAELGGQVRRGEASAMVVFFASRLVRRPRLAGAEDHADGGEKPGRPGRPGRGAHADVTVPVLRYYRVFNAAQADGLPGLFHLPATPVGRPEPQQVVDRYLRGDGPRLRHAAGDEACYFPAGDVIVMPPAGQFPNPAEYYATLFHELGHSTGHPRRLNRPGVMSVDHFGSDRYGREELVAEMTAAMLAAETGVDVADVAARNASYVGSWLRAIRGDKRLVVVAAQQAERACCLITGATGEGGVDAAGAVPAASHLAGQQGLEEGRRAPTTDCPAPAPTGMTL